MIYSTGLDSRPYSIVVDDVSRDDRSDIVITNSNTHNIDVPLGYGKGSFSIGTLYSTGESSFPYSVTIHDLNKDNQADVIVTNSDTNNVFVFYGYDKGTFAEPFSYFMGYESHPSSVVISDFDENGWIDIAAANYGTDNVEILFQTC
ncbi:unnamed protein product [Rotaria socialis]|uniref:VCBS repeat-containing protein n=1 Tax=Rotaria socialis TaxID=392032 RepID=A0A818PVG0_9BILA|nr:unnamed protein product [Rotaria socialis]CAF3377508.1 unnamed protein product [Rotaria socialis]CAF3625110.1 unnamed protein product [Rotaria socialis]CAF4161412.1 unnamed protein product [Rotaria socialis]CAF4163550.1 unnamed protein product [Rotaria socialis]